jgi:hypothetical protein
LAAAATVGAETREATTRRDDWEVFNVR